MRVVLIAGVMLMGGEAIAAPKIMLPLASGDQIGLSVMGKQQGKPGAAAMIGMWSDEGAVELAGFQDRADFIDASTARTAAIVSGRTMRSRGLRLTGMLHRNGSMQARGWTLSVDARQQQVSEVGAALIGTWRTASDSRLTLRSRLRF